MNTEKVLRVQEDSYFSRSSKQSSSRSQFDEEHSPVTSPTEELEENAWTESPQIFTAVDQDSKPLVVAIGVGYVHLISSIRVRLITRFSDSTSPKNASKRSQRSTEKGKQFVSQRAGESSVAMGMTRQLLGPLAATRRLVAGMSPELRHPNLSQSENQR
jgi:hypothetical protein